MSITEDNKQLKALYRKMGWWNDDLLSSRYARRSVGRDGELAVIDNHGASLTHRELAVAANLFASQISNLGLPSRSRIILIAPNRAAWVVAFLGILKATCIPAPVPTTTDVKTLAYMIDLISSQLIVTLGDSSNRALVEHVTSACEQASVGCGLVMLEKSGVVTCDRMPAGLAREEFGHINGCEDELHQLGFTSSTTGKPKAVMHTSNTLNALHETFSARFALTSDTPIFMPSPLGHSVGSYHGARLSLYNASTLVLQDKWDAREAIALMAETGAKFTAAATPFLSDLLDCKSFNGDCLRELSYFLCGGAPVPHVLLEQAQERFPNALFTNLWGMTEGGLVTCTDDCSQEKVINTNGIGLPGLELKILNPLGERCPTGAEGELVMRGPGVFIGYYNQPDLYSSLLTDDGFFRTEDLACMDAQGYLQITGRIKDVIIRGGVNISPIPIEDIFVRHPSVESAAVIGIPDDRLGERIGVVVLARDERLTLQELNDFALNAGLVKRHQAEVLFFVESMPLTAGGKVRKADLRMRFTPQREMGEASDANA